MSFQFKLQPKAVDFYSFFHSRIKNVSDNMMNGNNFFVALLFHKKQNKTGCRNVFKAHIFLSTLWPFYDIFLCHSCKYEQCQGPMDHLDLGPWAGNRWTRGLKERNSSKQQIIIVFKLSIRYSKLYVHM